MNARQNPGEIAPPTPQMHPADDPAGRVTARGLHLLFMAVLGWVALLWVCLPFVVERRVAAVVLSLPVALACLVALEALRRGHLKLAGRIYVVTAWLPVPALVLFAGGIGGIGLGLGLALLVTTAWVEGRRPALVAAVLFLAATFALALAAQLGWTPPRYFPAPPMATWLIALLAVGVTVFSLGSVLQALQALIERMGDLLRSARESERQVRESEQHFRDLIDRSPFAIGLFEPDGRRRFVNARFLELFGYAEAQVPDIHAWQRLTCPDPTYRAHVSRVWDRLAQQRHGVGGEPTEAVEWDLLCADGETRAVDIRTFVLGEAVVAVFNDITARRRAEKAAARLEAELAQAHHLESLGRLAGGIAHDFNNLLMVVNGYSDALASQLPGGSREQDKAVEIRRAGERAAHLTSQLLAFSRAQAAEAQPVGLNALVLEANPTLSRLLGDRVALTFQLDERLGPVLADPGQLQQVLLNLCANAADAMPDAGEVVIGTRNVDVGEDGLPDWPTAPTGPWVALFVQDNGVGMDEETRLRAFEPFFSAKVRGKGAGLGLSTVYGIVRQHDGWMTAASQPGSGTTITVYLPRAETLATSDAAVASQPDDIELRGNETILLVEDEREVRKLVSSLLEPFGYTVVHVSNGADALARLAENPGRIQLVLTDVVMPGMTGKELSDRVRVEYPQIPILFMSGYTGDVIATRGIVESGLPFIAKPFTARSLVRKVRTVLGGMDRV